MAQSIIDLVNCGGGVQQLFTPQALSATATSTQLNVENLTDTANVILSVGAVNAQCSGFQIWLEETPYSGGLSGWTVVTGCSFPATSGNVLGTTESGGSAYSGQTFVGRGLRQYQYCRANLSTFNQYSTSGQIYLSFVLVEQGKYTGTSGAVLNSTTSGITGFFGTGTDRYPSS